MRRNALFLTAWIMMAAAYSQSAEPSGVYLTSWFTCGPFDAGADTGPDTRQTLFNTDYLEPIGGEAKIAQRGWTLTDSGDVVWRRIDATGPAINLDDAVSKSERVLAYAVADFQCERAQACYLALGTNDGARVWLNGEMIWDFAPGRPLTLDDDLIPVMLREGTNRLLLKIEERGNRWEFAARFIEADDLPARSRDLFRVETSPAGVPELVFAYAPSLIGTLIKEARFYAYDPRGVRVWSKTIRGPASRWPIGVDKKTYSHYRLHGQITYQSGVRGEFDIPFEAGAPTENVLFDAGGSDYAIVLAENASDSERWAASELQRWIKESGGVELPILDPSKQDGGVQPLVKKNQDGQPQAIYVGLGRESRKILGGRVKTQDESDESFTYRNAGPAVVIWGGSQRGTMYGVLSFLERELGIRWYTPTVTSVPKKSRYAFRYLQHSEAPGIRVRNDFYFEAFDPMWAARNRVNGAMSLREQPGGVEGYWAVHTFYPLVPPDEFFATHPEYYSLIDGKRTTERAQLCLTNKDVLDILTERLMKVMTEQPDYLIYCVSQNDWYGACQCDDCQAIAQREGSEAGPIIWFVNQVAERVEKRFPDKYVGTLAYQYTRKPPKTLRPRENVVVRLCSIECCFAHDFKTCPENAEFMADLEGWAEIAPHMYIWDYVVNFSHYVMPYPNFGVLKSNIQSFRDNRAIGIMEQGAYQSRGGEFAELRMYVLAKLLWDPEADVDAIVDDFMYGYYGRSGQFVRAYFDLLHGAVTPDTHIHLGLQPDDSLFSDALIREADALFDRAEAVADSPEVLARVEMARLPLLYLKCKRDPKTAVYDGTYARFKTIAEREGVHNFAESGAPHREAFHRQMENAGRR